MITLPNDRWLEIKSILEKEYPRATFLIRAKMREDLGFTVREDSTYDPDRWSVITMVHLDFFDDSTESWFRLRFL